MMTRPEMFDVRLSQDDLRFHAEIESVVSRMMRQIVERENQQIRDLLEEAFVAGIEFERSCRNQAFGVGGDDPAPSFVQWLARKIEETLP